VSKLFALLSGLVFGIGLAVSGMTDPAKVRGFLDLAGRWDPSLAFVMIGAIGVHAIALRLVLKRPAPMLAKAFDLPPLAAIDRRLIAGAAIFGVGWGLAGVCPGPAIVSLGSFGLGPVVFASAMALGVLIERVSVRRLLRA
jgi:uncharacterized membrane protein YedE/YeeE